MNCRDIRNLLAGYVLGDLAEATAAEVRRHLETCPGCKAAEQAFRHDLTLVQGALAHRQADAPRLDAARRAAVLAARRSRPVTARIPVRRIIEWAAAAMIMIMLAALFVPGLGRSRVAAYRVPCGSGKPMTLGPAYEAGDASINWGYETDADGLSDADGDGLDKGTVVNARTLNLNGSVAKENTPHLDPLPQRERRKKGDSTYDNDGILGLPSNGKGGEGESSAAVVPAAMPPLPRGERAGVRVPEFESFKSGTEHEKQDESGRGYLPVLQSEKLSGYSVSKAPAKSEGTEHGVGNEIRGGQTRIYKGIRGKAQESGRGSEDAPAAEILFHVPDLDESNVGGIQAAVDAESQSCYVKDLDDSPVSGIQASAPVQPVSAPPPPSPVQLPAAQGMVTLRSVRGSAATPEPPSPRTVATSFSPKFKTVSGKELGAGIGSGYGVGGFGAGDRDESEKKTDISYRLEGKKKPDARNAGTTRRIDMIEPADATEAFAPADLPPGPGETAASGPEPVYPPQVYNPIIETKASPFSTFGIDVDTASFTLARRYLLGGRLPPTGAIRVEEFVNAFEYAYKPPENATFAVYCDRTRSPFRPSLEVLRIGVRGKVLGRDRQRPLALTFIVDTSGSMNTPDRLELARKAMTMLLDRLTDADSMAIVTFGSKARLVLDHTRAARKDEIRAAIASLQTSGSTHLEGGIRVGYEVAARRFRSGAANRVMIFSDGVANLGAATSDEILKQVETYRKQGVFCSVFGLGVGAYNDAMLQALADKGDGVYRYLDSLAEAKRVLVDEAAATLHVIAKDVKIQVEFQPDRVKAYRQIGYEKRHLEKEQFRDDAVDAGEVGSGQSSTALYELETSGAADSPLGIVRLRWKDPETGLVTETAHPIRGSDKPAAFEDAPPRFRLAVGVAELADWMRENPLSIGTEGGDILKVVRTAGMELNLDRQVKDVVRMATAASRLKKR